MSDATQSLACGLPSGRADVHNIWLMNTNTLLNNLVSQSLFLFHYHKHYVFNVLNIDRFMQT